MPLFWDKTTHARLYSIDTQETDTTIIPVGGTSIGGTITTAPNPCIGTKLWDRAAVMVNLGIAGGSFDVRLYGRVNGNTYPTARLTTTDNVAGTYVMTNLCQSPYMVQPSHIEFDETAAGGITATVEFVGKHYRGYFPGKAHDSDKIIEGRLIGSTVVTADATHNLRINPTAAQGGAAGAHFGGLEKYYLWDAACFFAETTTTTNGAWTVYIIGEIAGTTVVIAQSPSIAGNTKVAFMNQFYGAVPKPTAIIFDETSAGTWTGVIDFIAKGHRGQRSRR